MFTRGSVLQGILAGDVDSTSTGLLARTAISQLTSEDSWLQCPEQVEMLMERLLLLHNASGGRGQSRPRKRALFALLRELRTGWLQLPSKTEERLVAEGRGFPSCLVRREAEALEGYRHRNRRQASPLEAPSLKESFRRLRDRRSVQVALDVHDLNHGVAVTEAAATAGVDFIEVGDPLIKEVGLGAIEHIKRHFPQMTIVAEMMSADWGQDQVILAAEAGADVVLLIGPATTASVSAAVDAGRRFGVPIVLDVPAAQVSQQWIRDMERVGVDGFAVTTNIDIGVGGRHPLAKARMIRTWTRLPIAVSGGFSATDSSIVLGSDWDILIVGRSVTEAVYPAAAAHHLVNLAHGRKETR